MLVLFILPDHEKHTDIFPGNILYIKMKSKKAIVSIFYVYVVDEIAFQDIFG